MRKKHNESANRRLMLGRMLSATAATATVAYWRKPVVATVLLPAHAQTSTPPPDISSGTAGLVSATVENRIPSGGAPEPAIASVSFIGCTPGAATFSVVANLSPTGTTNLGSVTVPNVVPGVVYTLAVAPTIVAAVASVNTLTITTSGSAGTTTQNVAVANTTTVLTGGSLSAACP